MPELEKEIKEQVCARKDGEGQKWSYKAEQRERGGSGKDRLDAEPIRG